MALRCVVVMRGINKPLVVDAISNMALAFGADPSRLIATQCAKDETKNNSIKAEKEIFFNMARGFLDLRK
jgi:hypothetical protein